MIFFIKNIVVIHNINIMQKNVHYFFSYINIEKMLRIGMYPRYTYYTIIKKFIRLQRCELFFKNDYI